MNHTFCPGSKILRQPTPELFTCPSCGEDVEIWTDEPKRTCRNCRTVVYRDAGMSCLDWCKRGKECVGDSIYDTYMQNKAVVLKTHLLAKMHDHFGNDKERIDHAETVLANAEKLVQSEKADWHIVIPASILHDVGITVTEAKYGSSAGKYQEIEGPPIAREILLRLGLKMEDIDEICDIIAHHHSPGEQNSDNFRVLYDADSLVNLREVVNGESDEQICTLIEKNFLTKTGRELALKEFVSVPVEVYSGR